MNRPALAVVLGFVLSGAATAGLLGPANYDECILENMKGVGSDMAARAVAASCAKQFPAKSSPKATPPRSSTPSGKADQLGTTETKSGEFTNFVPDPAK